MENSQMSEEQKGRKTIITTEMEIVEQVIGAFFEAEEECTISINKKFIDEEVSFTISVE